MSKTPTTTLSTPPISGAVQNLSPADQRAVELLMERMLRLPFAGNTLAQAERRRWDSPEVALVQRYVLYNPDHRFGVLSTDQDKFDVEAAIADAALMHGIKLPLPNFQTRRKNGNAQAHWLLQKAVGTTAAHRRGPQLFAATVHRRLKFAFGSDPNCVGRVMRGLYHPQQTTRIYHANLFDLNGLAAMLPPAPRCATLPSADGRNHQMFRALDTYAARLAADGVDVQSSAFGESLLNEGQRLMPELPAGDHPYSNAELRRTVASVVKRTRMGTNAKYARAGGIYIPSVVATAVLRHHYWSTNRPPPLDDDTARAHMAAAVAPANAARRQSAQEVYVAAAQRLVARGEPLTEARMAHETGRSARRVREHASVWRAVSKTPTPCQCGKNEIVSENAD